MVTFDQNSVGKNGGIFRVQTSLEGSNAYDFSGAEGVWVANSAAHNSDYATISFWVKVNELPISGEVFLLSNGGWQERWKISLPSHGKPVFTTHSGGACCSDMDSGDTRMCTPVASSLHTVIVSNVLYVQVTSGGQ